jgi:hypothetical protein
MCVSNRSMGEHVSNIVTYVLCTSLHAACVLG